MLNRLRAALSRLLGGAPTQDRLRIDFELGPCRDTDSLSVLVEAQNADLERISYRPGNDERPLGVPGAEGACSLMEHGFQLDLHNTGHSTRPEKGFQFTVRLDPAHPAARVAQIHVFVRSATARWQFRCTSDMNVVFEKTFSFGPDFPQDADLLLDVYLDRIEETPVVPPT